jgi:hypothetical protein
VVGYGRGELKQITPSGEVKRVIEKPSFVNSTKILNVLWIEDTVFVVLYCDEQDTEVVVINRSENRAYTILDPAASFGSPNPNRYYLGYLTSSNVFKHCIVIGNEASTDVGVIGCDLNGLWTSWTLEEGSSIVMPIEDDEDTYPLGMDILFCNKVQLPGVTPDDPSYPAFPILLVTNNKGSVMGYHCMHKKTQEGDPFLASMVSAKAYGDTSDLNSKKLAPAGNAGLVAPFSTAKTATVPSSAGTSKDTKSVLGSSSIEPTPFSFTKVEKKEQSNFFGSTTLGFAKATSKAEEPKFGISPSSISATNEITLKSEKTANPFLGSGATPSLFSAVKPLESKPLSGKLSDKSPDLNSSSKTKQSELIPKPKTETISKKPSESAKQQLLVNEFDKHYSALQADLKTVVHILHSYRTLWTRLGRKLKLQQNLLVLPRILLLQRFFKLLRPFNVE